MNDPNQLIAQAEAFSENQIILYMTRIINI